MKTSLAGYESGWVSGSSTVLAFRDLGGGVEPDRYDHAHLLRRYTFDSAHNLANAPLNHKCRRMHGHGFAAIVHADGDPRDRDVGIDSEHLDELWALIHAELNFACLNDIRGLENPTSELISNWIWQRLKPQLPELSWVTVYETANCGAHFDGTHYRLWRETTLDSAMRLMRAPESDPRRRVHGHTYTLRLHLHAPLDDVMGWIIDFGDVKQLFGPVFEQLDHHPLHEVSDLEDNDAATPVRWIRRQTAGILLQLDRIDLYETRGCGTILTWGEAGPALPLGGTTIYGGGIEIC